MKVLLDTNVLLAALLHEHSAHERALTVLLRVQNKKDEGFISAHSVAELYSTLTRIPPPFRHSPEQALLSIEENVLKHFQLVALSAAEYGSMVREMASAGIQGGAIYDAIVLRCAQKAQVGRVYTSNLKHFQTVAPPDFAGSIVAP